MASTVSDREIRGNDFKVYYSEQTAKGAINASPTFTPIKRVSGKPQKTVQYESSESITDDLNNALEQVQTGVEYGAELETEVTKQSIRLAIQAIHGVVSAVSLTATDIAATATGFTSVAEEFDDIRVGDGIWVTGFSTSSINGFYIVATKPDDGEITTTVAPATTESAGQSVTITSNVYDNGVSPTYNAVQTRVVDDTAVGSINYHTLYDGIVNTMNLEVPDTGFATATVGMIFEKENSGSAAISGQTDASAPTDKIVSSWRGTGTNPSVIQLYVDGAEKRCTIKSFTWEVNNNYQVDNAAGCNDLVASRGQFESNLSFVARSYKSDSMLWRDKSWDGTRNAYGLRISHGNGDETYILWRRVVLTEVNHADGNNVISNAECSGVLENDPNTSITCTVYTNWS